MGRSFLLVLVILMIGIAIGLFFFSANRAEAVDATHSQSDILDAAGKALGATCNAASAYAFLRTRANGNVKLVPSTTGGSGTARGGIDPELACRLQKLLQARSDIKIISGYRSAAYQRSLCGGGRKGCAPPGKSCHQYGLAVDVNKGDKSLRQYVKQFGLHFPYSGNHIQCQEHVRAGCSPSTPPCAKGGVRINGGTDPGPSYNPGSVNNPYQGQPTPQSALNSLQNPGSAPTTGGATDGGYIPYYDEPYEVNEEGADPNGPLDEYYGDGPPAFDDLLGDFGEFNEGSEVRNVLGYEDEGRASTTQRFGTSTPTEVIKHTGPGTTTANGECIDGIPTRTILGTVICQRTGPGPVPFTGVATRTNATGTSRGVIGTVPVTSAFATLASHILPLRHLVGPSNERFYDDSGLRFQAYDAYYPGTGIAGDVREQQYPVEEQLLAWLLQEDPEEIENTQDPALKSLTLLVRPMLAYIVVALFGTGGHAADALLTFMNRVQ